MCDSKQFVEVISNTITIDLEVSSACLELKMLAMSLVGALLSILLTLGACMNSDPTSRSRYGASHSELTSLHQDPNPAYCPRTTRIKRIANARHMQLLLPHSNHYQLLQRHGPHPLNPDPALPRPSLNAPKTLLHLRPQPKMPPGLHIHRPLLVRTRSKPPRFQDSLHGATTSGPDEPPRAYVYRRRQMHD